jgi:type I restriction-modification system DNA methylase subunit/RecB family exonuclease
MPPLCPQNIKNLVANFGSDLAQLKSTHYKEQRTRERYINPLFEALGWNVNNEGLRLADEEVIHEDRQVQPNGTVAPDYTFRVHRRPAFHVEAKKPTVDIAHDRKAAAQLRRYGYTSQMSWSVLTDFEELAIYDCEVPPEEGDPAETALLAYYKFDEFEEKWPEIWGWLSKEQVIAGTLAKHVSAQRGRKGAVPVGARLLDDLRGWRRSLASDLMQKNPTLSPAQLKIGVERTLDRLLFLRICEDRGIETFGSLRNASDGAKVYQKLTVLFRESARKYGSGLFHFSHEPSRDTHIDTWTLNLQISDAALHDVIRHMYQPHCPFMFNRLPADILGQVYEQLLGDEITVDDVSKTERTAVRKKTGVYYTPVHMVDHVVARTLGPLTNGKSASAMRKIQILDPACGSGSFLLAAYQHMLDAHLHWYLEDDQNHWLTKKTPTLTTNPAGRIQLTIGERKRILTQSIFGVDIDDQAVQVTRLSLLLKVLEGEDHQSISEQQQMFHARALPELAHNIVHGNALIGDDFFKDNVEALTDPAVRKRVAPMSWQRHFGEQLTGGFDAIVGNPPWGQKGIAADPNIKAYIQRTYPSSKGIYDLFRAFVEKGFNLLRDNGRFGMVFPDIVLLKNYVPTRKLILESLSMNHIDWWGMAFADAVIDAVTIVGQKKKPSKKHAIHVTMHDPKQPLSHTIAQAAFWNTEGLEFNLTLTPTKLAMLEKVADCPRFKDFMAPHEGVHSGNMRAELFVSEKLDDTCKPMIFGRDEISRYGLRWKGQYVRLGVVPEKKTKERTCSVGQPIWYSADKLLIRRTGDYIMAAVDREGRYASNNMFVVSPTAECGLDLDGLCALLNSPFMTWYFRTIHPRVGRAFAELKIRQMKRFPLPPSDTPKNHLDRLNQLGQVRAKLSAQIHEMPEDMRADITESVAIVDAQIADCVADIFGFDQAERARFPTIDEPKHRVQSKMSKATPTTTQTQANFDGLGPWFEQIASAGTDASLTSTLVLCRTGGIADSMRRAIARRGGMLGVEITTPAGLATLTAQEDKEVAIDAPADNPLWRRLGGAGVRPGLEAQLAEWVRLGRLCLLNRDELPEVLSSVEGFTGLVESGWGQDSTELAATHLMERLKIRAGAAKKGPTAAEAVDRVLAIGFLPGTLEGQPGHPSRQAFVDKWMPPKDAGATVEGVPAWVNQVLTSLDAEHLDVGDGRIDDAVAIPTITVPDVTAEARACTRWLRHLVDSNAGSVLVLVPDTITASRLHAMAARYHIDTCVIETNVYGSHALAPVLRALQPLFERGETDPILRASQLQAWLCSTVVGQHWQADEAKALRQRIQPLLDDDAVWEKRWLRLSSRAVRNVLREAHIVEATRSEWHTRLELLGAQDHNATRSPDRMRAIRRGAILLAARLNRLEMCLRADAASNEAPTPTESDPEVLNLVGGETDDHDVAHVDQVGGGTIGAMRQLLLDGKVRVGHDPVGRGLISLLRENQKEPATIRTLNRILNQEARSKRLHGGIEVLTYSDYDGRAVDELVLLGVHDKGLCAIPSPDPFLSESATAALGMAGGRQAVMSALVATLQAVSRAKNTLAFVNQRDASGRRVVAPIELNLDEDAGLERWPEATCVPAVESFGLNLMPLMGLQVVPVEDANDFPKLQTKENTETEHLAIQASCEWYRAGKGTRKPVPPAAEGVTETLADVLDRHAPLGPPSVMPYLGAVSESANDMSWAVKDGQAESWSVSRHFEPLTTDLYRFFVERVLRIRDDEPISDELDPRDIGNAVHGAFEDANPPEGSGIDWRPSGLGQERDLAVAAARDTLVGLTREQIDKTKEEMGLTHPAILRATDGLRDRWNRHWVRNEGDETDPNWVGYLSTRIIARGDKLEKRATKLVTDHIRSVSGFAELVDSIVEGADLWAIDGKLKQTKGWLVWALQQAADGVDLAQMDPKVRRDGDGKNKLSPGKKEQKEQIDEVLIEVVSTDVFKETAKSIANSVGAIHALKDVVCGKVDTVITELPFGPDAADLGVPVLENLTLPLAGERHPVRGKIDRVMVVATEQGTLLQILDYKTGASKSAKTLITGMTDLSMPQLPIYALALREALREQIQQGGDLLGIPADAKVAVLAYDFVRKATAAGLVDTHLVTDDDLDNALTALDSLVRRGKSGDWSILPVNTAPTTHAWGWSKGAISLQDAARFEGMPGAGVAIEVDEEDDNEDDANATRGEAK